MQTTTVQYEINPTSVPAKILKENIALGNKKEKEITASTKK